MNSPLDMFFAIGRYYALAHVIQRAREYTKRAIKMDGSLRAEFLEESTFDSVWNSFLVRVFGNVNGRVCNIIKD